MADITQQLGFDVSAALSSLNQLNSAIGSHITVLGNLRAAYSNLNLGTTAIAGVNTALAQTATTATGAANAVQTITPAVQQLTNQATPGVNALNSSFSSLVSRILLTQTVVSGFANVRGYLKESIGEAIEYQRALAGIQTIAPALQGDFEGLSQRVRAVSNELNTPLIETAAGLYGIISDQIQGTANQFAVLAASQKLAKTTFTDTDQAAQLLTASINGFGLTTSEVDNISAKWFRTIDLGRVTADELSNSIGRLSKLSEQTGISMEEVQAALATITISGVNASEAITQLRGVFTALIKPTKEMEEVLTKLGFTSGEQAIDLLGLSGTLTTLRDAVGGSSEGLAELFPLVRGLSGVLNLASRDAEVFNNNLREIEATTNATLEDAYQIVITTDAEKVTKELNKLKNFLTEEFGQAVLSSFVAVSDSVGGTDSLNKSLAFLIGSLGGAVAAYVTYRASVTASTTATNLFGASVGNGVASIGRLATGLLTAVALYQGFSAAVKQSLQESSDEFDRGVADKISNLTRSNGEEIRDERNKWKELNRITSSGIADALKMYGEQSSVIKAESERQAESITSAATKVFDLRERLIDRLNKESTAADLRADKVQSEIANNRIRTEDTLFQRSLRRYRSEEQITQTLSRSLKISKEASQLLKNAEGANDKSSADSAFERAAALEQQAFQIAKASGNTDKMKESERILSKLTKDRTAALEEYEQKQRQFAASADKQSQAESTRLTALRKEFAGISDSFLLIGKNGALSKEDREKNVAGALKSLSEFQKKALDFEGIDLGTLLNITQIQNELQRSLTTTEINDINFGASAFSSLNETLNVQLDRFFADKTVELDVELVAKSTGEAVTDPTRLTEAVGRARDFAIGRSNLVKEINVQKEAITQTYATAVNDVKLAVENEESVLGTIFTGLFSAFNSSSSQQPAQAQEAFTGLASEILTLGQASTVTVEQLTGLSTKLTNLKALAQTGTFVPGSVEQIESSIIKLKEAYDLTQTLSTSQEQLGQFIQTNTFQPATTSVDTMNTSLGNTATQIGNAAAQTTSLIQGLKAAAAAAAAIQIPSGGPTTRDKFSNGGVVYRAGGGYIPRGSDTVPAMLSPGESVISARNTRKFSAQISAINAGISPSYRSNGGPVSNTTIGDINVSLQGSDTSRGSARQIATELRRELRRGTSKV
jgi:TP901 family phage tail tape measure protein